MSAMTQSDPGPRAERIEQILSRQFSPTALHVVDDSARHAGHAGATAAGETHYSVTMVAAGFTGLSRVARARMVHDALAAEFAGGLHALALTLRAPAEITPRG